MPLKNIKVIEEFFYNYPETKEILKNIVDKDKKLVKKLIEKISNKKIKNLEELTEEINIYNKKKKIKQYIITAISSFLLPFFVLYPNYLYNPEINKNNLNKKMEKIEEKVIKKDVIEFEDYLKYYRITSKFLEKRAKGGLNSRTRRHEGIDLAANKKEDRIIKAFTDGNVFYVGSTPGYGKFLITEHKINGKIFEKDSEIYLYCFYSHCKKIYVKKGSKIKIGSKIAYMGETGKAKGVHLHLEMRISEKPLKNLNEYFDLDPKDPVEIIEKFKKYFHF